MKKYIKSHILQIILILVISVYLPVAFAQERNVKVENENENKVSLSDDDESDIDDNDDDSDGREEQNKNDEDNESGKNNDDNDDANEDESDVEDDDNDDVDDADDESDVEDDEVDDIDDDSDEDEFTGEDHRSAVAASVLNLLEVAGREKGDIGEQIRVIAQEQNVVKETIATEIDEIQNRSKVKTFLIGTDYKNTGKLRSDMVKTSSQIDKLNEILNKAADEENKIMLEEQIQTLKQQQEKIGILLENNESKFSLFGWFVKLFVK